MTLTPEDESRIRGRKFCEEFLEEAFKEGKAFIEGFTRAIHKAFPVEQTGPFTGLSDKDAKEFEDIVPNFRKYPGIAYRDIPTSFIAWLADKQVMLQKYVRSERFKHRLEMEEQQGKLFSESEDETGGWF